MEDLIDDLRLHEIYKRIPECWYELSLVNKSTRRDIARVYHLYGEENPTRAIVEIMIKQGRWYELLRSTASPDKIMAWASGGGHTSIIELMLARGAGNWNWAMVCASAGGHLDIVQYMIKRGAKRWKHAIDAAKWGGHSSVVELIEQKRKEHKLMIEKLSKKCIPERRW